MNPSTDMKVSTRLALGFGLAVFLGIVIAVFATLRMKALAADLDTLANDRMVKVDKFTDVKDNANSVARAVRNLIIVHDPAAQQAEKNKIADVGAANAAILTELDAMITLPKAREMMDQLKAARPAYYAALSHVVELAETGREDEAGKFLLAEVRPRQDAIFKVLDDSRDYQHDLAMQLAAQARADASRDALVLLGLALAIALVGGAIAWTIVRSLSRALGAEPAEVSAAVQRVADGDLSTPVVVREGDAASTMAAVERMRLALTSIVSAVRGNSESVATASAQIAQGNIDLSQRTEEQASALQQTAATMEELNATVRTNASNAHQANQLALGATDVAARGGQVVGQFVDTMKGINDSSRRISDILAVIDGIAFQTNILALNAAVEAARAGEQGRGFAVVAAEVRSLAQRSAGAAREIKTLITSSVEQVEKGTTLVDQAGRTMDEIVVAIRHVSDIVGEISSASDHQSAGVSQVGQAVSQMDQVTQQNAALVEESAAAAESLRQQAQQLVRAVSVFRVDAAAAADPLH